MVVVVTDRVCEFENAADLYAGQRKDLALDLLVAAF